MIADTIIVALVLAYCVFVLVRRFKPSKRAKGSPCSGCCASCSGCCCGNQKPEKRERRG